jgi:hypothetical protein
MYFFIYSLVTSNKDVGQTMENLRTGVQQKKRLLDEDVMAMFNQETIQMLRLIKKDDSLVQRFHDAESAAESSDDDDESSCQGSTDSNLIP